VKFDPHVWATIPEIAYLYGWTEGYTRKLASRDKWRRHGHGPRVYNLHDVGRSASLTRPRRTGTHCT
jgi:hypothetical protein